MKIRCDNCNKEFKIKNVKLKEEEIAEGITKIFYKCPKCKYEYIVSYRDKEILDNIGRIKELTKEVEQGSKEAEVKIKNLIERNKIKSARYKALFK